MDLPADRKVFVASWEDVRRSRWPAGPAPGDVVVTMGAPPISLMGDELLAALAAYGGSADATSTRRPRRRSVTGAGGASGGDGAASWHRRARRPAPAAG